MTFVNQKRNHQFVKRIYHREAERRDAVCHIVKEHCQRKIGDLCVERTWGGYFCRSCWNSAAHSPQGYSRELRWKYELSATRSSGVGCFEVVVHEYLNRLRWDMAYLWVSKRGSMSEIYMSPASWKRKKWTHIHSNFQVARPRAALRV